MEGKGVVQKCSWSAEEDQILMELVATHGPKKWSLIASSLQGRIGKQCRERWHNHLNPNVRKDAWTQDEDDVISDLVDRIGTKWATIAKHLHGRTDNSIKNRYYSSLKKVHEQKRTTGSSTTASPTKPASSAATMPSPHRKSSTSSASSSAHHRNDHEDSLISAPPTPSPKRRKQSLDSVSSDGFIPIASQSSFSRLSPMSVAETVDSDLGDMDGPIVIESSPKFHSGNAPYSKQRHLNLQPIPVAPGMLIHNPMPQHNHFLQQLNHNSHQYHHHQMSSSPMLAPPVLAEEWLHDGSYLHSEQFCFTPIPPSPSPSMMDMSQSCDSMWSWPPTPPVFGHDGCAPSSVECAEVFSLAQPLQPLSLESEYHSLLS